MGSVDRSPAPYHRLDDVVSSRARHGNPHNVKIDQRTPGTVGADVVAATLVHEAAHLDRSFHGTTCLADDSCTVLTNAVLLDEEVAAHAAEARWWLAIYGREGKSDPDPVAAWQNHLATAYLTGPESFAAFVESFRSDAEEASR